VNVTASLLPHLSHALPILLERQGSLMHSTSTLKLSVLLYSLL